jgi:hypothetical protein
MTLEWLRRRDAVWDEQLRNYLFTEKPVLEVEHAIEEGEEGGRSGDGSLGIGSLRGEVGR